MIRLLTGLMVMALLVFLTPIATIQAQEVNQSASILAPHHESIKTRFQYRLDAVDPSPQSNPAGRPYPGYRGPHQLVVYTPAFGETTRTNAYGFEAVVRRGRVVVLSGANSFIPADGFVVSGQGQAGQWLQRTVKPGAKITLLPAQGEIQVELTPEVYVVGVQRLLEQAERRGNLEDSQFQAVLHEGKACLSQLETMAPQGVTPQLVSASQHCEKLANKAYYQSLPAERLPFRGIWVRPVERSPQEITEAVKTLKAAHIQHLFIEAYYQGRTIYPSDVMAQYGLSKQHAQFEGWDPLQSWVTAAQQEGLKVHLWVQTFFAGNQQDVLETYGPILQKYPQWVNLPKWAADKGKPVPSTVEPGHYFLDPGHPEVRTFLTQLLMEMVTRYPVDGINLDYIRYPASYSPTHGQYLASTWGYSPAARKAFQEMLAAERAEAQKALEAKAKLATQKQAVQAKRARGKQARHSKSRANIAAKSPVLKTDPKDFTLSDPLWPRWVAWRKDQVTGFVRDISNKMRAVRPGLLVSAVVFPIQDSQNVVKLQDWPKWVDQGYVHALTPIGLAETPDKILQQSLDFKRLTQDKAAVYIGNFGLYNRVDAATLLLQLEAVRRAGMQGVVLFERSRLDKNYIEALAEGPFRE